MYRPLGQFLIQLRDNLKAEGFTGKFVISVPQEDIERLYNGFRARNPDAMPRGRHKDWRTILEGVPIIEFDERDKMVS